MESEADNAFAFDISKFSTKIIENKKYLVYIVLFLILLLSIWLRMIPASYPYLASADPYWQYRHSREIYENGYPGTGLKEVDGKMVPWDYFHNAPEGSPVGNEFYQYFVAYSYKYFAKLFFPTLMEWMKYTPVLFAFLAVLSMFLLVRQLFGEKPGLAAAFMFGLATPYLTRSYATHADTDAIIMFFTLFTMYLFILAWDRKSLIYATFAGVSLGFFGWTWPGGYTYIPLILIGATFFYFAYKLIFTAYKKESIPASIKRDWKNYAVILLFLAVGLGMVAIIEGPGAANVLKSLFNFMNLRAMQRTPGTGEVRNVLLTVAEMNPTNTRYIISAVHVSSVITALLFFFLLPFGLWKQLKEKAYHLFIFILWTGITFYAALNAMRFIQMFAAPLSIFTGLVIADLYSKIELKKPMTSILIVIFLVSIIFFVPNITPQPAANQVGPSYFSTALQTAKGIGGGPGQNWMDFYNWIRTETPKNTIMASWWDPGHEVTALGERAVVADGSQNYEHIHDLAVIFTTTNETQALELLKKYNVTYFFTSSDLIYKYGAISFLGTGKGENYPMIPLSEAKQLQNSTILIYNLDQNTGIYVEISNTGEEITATLRQGYQAQKIARVFYFPNNTGRMKTEPENNTIDAMLFLQPDFRYATYLPPHLEKNMLTRLYFFNGIGLEKNFQMVKDFNSEIKVYKMIYS